MLNYLKKSSFYFILNFLFLIFCLIVAKSDIKFFLIPLVSIYIMLNLFLNERVIVNNQIILSILYSIIYTFLWGARTFDVPMEMKYIIYLLNFIIILKILMHFNVYKKCLKDWIVIAAFVFIIISGIVAIFSGSSFTNYIMSLQIYLRFLPAYIVISANNKYSKDDLYAFCLLNVFMLFIEYLLYLKGKVIPDSVSGIFGLSNVQALLLFFIVIFSIALICYIYKKINLITFSIIVIALFVIAGLGEMKMFFLATPFIVIIILLLCIKRFFRFAKVILPIVILMVIGIRILISVSPFFAGFFNLNKIQDNIYNYTMVSNNPNVKLGRLENIVYTNDYILTTNAQKFYGLGVGNAMPDENWYYISHNNNIHRKIINLYSTPLYENYGYLGYHFSSMNIIYLETGFIGFSIFYFVIMVMFYRSYKLFEITKEFNNKCLSIAGVTFLFVFTLLMFYYPYLLDLDTSLMFSILIALITNKYKQIKAR